MINVTKKTLSILSLQNTEKKTAGAKRKSRHPASDKISLNMIIILQETSRNYIMGKFTLQNLTATGRNAKFLKFGEVSPDLISGNDQ